MCAREHVLHAVEPQACHPVGINKDRFSTRDSRPDPNVSYSEVLCVSFTQRSIPFLILTFTVQSGQTNSAVLCSQTSTDGVDQPVHMIVCVEKNVDRSNMAMIGENFLVPADTISN